MAPGSRSDSLSTSPGINKVTKVKDTDKAGPDGKPASQRGGKCFKIYRQVQRIESRERRGVSKLNSLEMLPKRGG